jgi:hypothetical protein
MHDRGVDARHRAAKLKASERYWKREPQPFSASAALR